MSLSLPGCPVTDLSGAKYTPESTPKRNAGIWKRQLLSDPSLRGLQATRPDLQKPQKEQTPWGESHCPGESPLDPNPSVHKISSSLGEAGDHACEL